MSDPRATLEQWLPRLAAAAAGQELRLGAPSGPAWWPLPDAAAQAGAWHPGLWEAQGDRRASAAFLAGWLARVPALAVGVPAVLAGVVPLTDAAGIRVHRHPDGWFDGLAINPTEVIGGAWEEVLAAAGRSVAALTDPVVGAVSAALPIGAPAVWGGVADALSGHALRLAPALGVEQAQAWERAQRIIDELQRSVLALRHRPRHFPVVWSGGTFHSQVRATCCLYYRVVEAPDPEGDGYCVTCPLRTDGSRRTRLRAYLEATDGGATGT